MSELVGREFVGIESRFSEYLPKCLFHFIWRYLDVCAGPPKQGGSYAPEIARGESSYMSALTDRRRLRGYVFVPINLTIILSGPSLPSAFIVAVRVMWALDRWVRLSNMGMHWPLLGGRRPCTRPGT